MIKIPIIAQDWDGAVRYDPTCCLVANAIRRHFQADRADVLEGIASVRTKEKIDNYDLHPDTSLMISLFDDGMLKQGTNLTIVMRPATDED